MSPSNVGNMELELYSFFNSREYVKAYDLIVQNPELLDTMTFSEIKGFYRNLKSKDEEEATKFLNLLENLAREG